MVTVFDCDVGHSMCILCYVQYIEDALNNRRFKEHRQYGYTIQCPGMTWVHCIVCEHYFVQRVVMVLR